MDFIDQVTQRVADRLMPKIVAMIAHSGAIALEGVIVKGTYDPATGRASVLQGDTAAVFTDEGDQPIVHYGVPIHTWGIGNQEGPQGDERVKLVATQSGYVAMLVHDSDDSPGAAPGESVVGAYASSVSVGAKKAALTSSDAAMRAANSQTLANAIIAHVQTAINAGFAACQPGGGVTAPTISAVTASGSATVRIKA